MEKKTCLDCKIEKNITDFEKRADTGKYRNQCKDCRNIYVKKYKTERSSGQRKKNTIEVVNNQKKCIKCKQLKPLDQFPKRENTEHGYRHECKACKTIALHEYYINVYNEVRRNRKQTDIEYKLICNHRSYIYKCLTKFGNKHKRSLQYLGCTLKMFKKWLEFMFDSDMTWDNYGTVWTIDHVIPLNIFDLTDKKQQNIAFNWKNIQPLKDNSVKNDNLRIYEYCNLIISVHRFIQNEKLKIVEYQGLNESLNWLREKLRYGKNLIDRKSYDINLQFNNLRIDDPQPSSSKSEE